MQDKLQSKIKKYLEENLFNFRLENARQAAIEN